MNYLTQYLIRCIVLIGLILNVTCASERSTEEINNIAKNWIALNHKSNQRSIDKKVNLRTISPIKQAEINYQIIKLKPKGWIIVSKDDVAHPILGYSYESDIDTLLKNDSYQNWMKGMNQEIELLKEKGLDNDADIELSEILSSDMTERDLLFSRAVSVKEKGPLIERSWRQGSPYNGMTPKIDGRPTLVGCVATAWVQIMDYWQWPTSGRGHFTYTINGLYDSSLEDRTLSVTFNTSYNWINMTNEDKAKISYHVGVANSMEYGLDGSGAWPSPRNMRKFFYYNMTNRIKKSNKSIKWWKNKIKKNIDSKRPIFYSGYNSSVVGHAFNLDGYRFESKRPSFYHFNWGGGGSHGWYTLEANQDHHMNFFNSQEAIFNIHPKSNFDINLPSPTDLNVTDITKNSTILTWKDNSNNEIGFKIYRGTKLVRTVEASVTTADIRGLSPNTTYTYTVKAYSSIGLSEGTSTTFKTGGSTISKSIIISPAQNSKFDANTSINLKWENNGATLHAIYIRAKVRGEWKTVSFKYIPSTVTNYSFKLPSRFTIANVELHSYNEFKDIGYSKIILYTKDKLVEPSNLKVKDISEKSATLVWNYNSYNETGFNIYEGSRLVRKVDANVRSISLLRLNSNTTYTYTVKAYNPIELSKGASTTFKTEGLTISKSIITSPVENEKFDSNTSINLKWKHNGATKHTIYVKAKVKGEWKTVIFKYILSTVTDYSFKLPSGFTSAYIELRSYNGLTSIGYSEVTISPKSK